MPKFIPIDVGDKHLKLKFGHQAVSEALTDLQARVPSGLLGGLKLQLEQACRLLEAGDPHAINAFIRRGIQHERRVTEETLYGWLDEHTDPEGRDGSLVELAEPIEAALSAAGMIVRERKIIDAEGNERKEIERPHLARAGALSE